MFRARFNDVFPKSLANFGPQELERDIVDSPPGDRVENFLCALLGLLLNRKQDVKYVFFSPIIAPQSIAAPLPLSGKRRRERREGKGEDPEERKDL